LNRFADDPRLDGALAGFLADVRATNVSDPDDVVAARHLTAIAREARSAADQKERRANGRGPSV
jgi:hypothetical protein